MPSNYFDTNRRESEHPHLRAFKWPEMASYWSQEGKNLYAGACYGGPAYEPEAYFEIEENGPRILYMLPRYCSSSMAKWWVDFMMKELVPARVQKEMVVTLNVTRSDWPRWNKADVYPEYRRYLSSNRDIHDYSGPASFDAEDEYLCRVNHEQSPHLPPLFPFATLSFSQDASAYDMFITATLVRYISEHVSVIVATKLLTEQFPELPGEYAYLLGQHLSYVGGHAIGNFSALPLDSMKATLEKTNFRSKWDRCLKARRPFHELPTKAGAVDDIWPNWAAGRPAEYVYATTGGLISQCSVRGKKVVSTHSHIQGVIDGIEKLLSNTDVAKTNKEKVYEIAA